MPAMRSHVIGTALLLLLTGCALRTADSPGSSWLTQGARVSEPTLSCAEATRVAREALMRMGYSLASVEAPKPDAPGRVVGTRDTGWSSGSPEAGTLRTATVTISCSDAGADFAAVTDEGFGTQATFPQTFAQAVKAAVSHQKVRPKPQEEPQAGLVLRVEPQGGSSGGMTPVKFEVTNRTSRPYGFRRDGVELVTTQGKREKPLPPPDASARDRELQDATIQPGQSVNGYLYFSAAAYRRARVILTDIESGEPEGFSVEF